MKFNWKKIIVSGVVAGMVIVTGCAGLPENNHGNRNGERLTNAVARDGATRGMTRGINRTTNRVGGGMRFKVQFALMSGVDREPVKRIKRRT